MALFDRFKKSNPQVDDQALDAAAGEEARDQPQPKAGLVSRFRRGLQKTSDLLNTDIRDLFKRDGRLVDDEFLDELFAILVKTDMGAGPAGEIRDRVQSEYRGRVVEMEDVLGSVKASLRELMAQDQQPIQFAANGPTVIMVVGVNGSGKTTSIAKLAHMFTAQGRRVVLGAGDTFRAAAVEQLTIWAERIGADIVTGKAQGDPASVAYQAVDRTLQTNADVCIIDTAGRLQTQVNLMQQLEKIRNVIGTEPDSRSPARSAAGARCYGRPKRDQPGEGILGGGRLHGNRTGQTGWHCQRRCGDPDSPPIHIAGQVRRTR